ncbi:LacI family transcriptional regulator [Geodermatophilus sp. YIM 151500]|uniref:LacI family DNA-binding transcriptional regulator n=1 Tax=Geodermatophilus sp. YIM 151500 TaxID=2984531 RepID=UPI0021E3E8FF|nr:LacI family DNA-binding transcriptional regulator [Geodermatophilus sp. YIM 151500]MCV2490282.1 LacI family transcriptional regulator [Geodermatophilus sp. YIM 151500]
MSVEEPVRRPRLQDVAHEAGVSTATASLVLRGAPGPGGATRERVLAAAGRLGYRPDRAASLLARRRSRLIGVVMDVRSTFHAQLVEEVHEAAERHGYDLVLSAVTRNRDEARAVETLLDSRCEALVLLGSEAPTARLAALDRQLPVVAVGRPVPSAGVDVVRAADDEGVAMAVDHLAGLGHRRIAYVDGGRGPIAAGRRRGYQRGMRRHRLGGHLQVVAGDPGEESGARAARTLFREGRGPTAVVAYNDHCAVGLLDALLRDDVDVPGAVSVVGYDDSPLARLAHVDLTTVSQESELLVRHAVEAVVERLDGGRTEHREVVVPPRLVVRGTTGPPRDDGSL